MIQLLKKYFIIICFVLLTLINFSFNFFREKENNDVIFLSSQDSGPIKVSLEESLNYTQQTASKPPMQEIYTQETPKAEKAEISERADKKTAENIKDEVPVYVCGEVLNPGVYYVNSDAIVDDIIKLAGGFKEEADTKQLNLASVVMPNSKIYVPKIGEEIDKIDDSYENRVDATSDLNTQPEKVVSATHLININTADQSTLEQLPGIGKVKAQAIIDYRNQNGGFDNINDLLNVSGIGQKTFDKLKNLICT